MSKVSDFDFYCEVALKPGAAIEKIYESDRVLAYYHTKPVWEKHIVIVSKEHVWDMRQVEDTTLFEEMMRVTRDIMRTMSQEELDTKGAKLLTNFGKFQDTPHLHFHIAVGKQTKAFSDGTLEHS